MSFFNLTHMGYDSTVAQSLEQKTAGAAEGSHVKYAALKTKHTRSDKGNVLMLHISNSWHKDRSCSDENE